MAGLRSFLVTAAVCCLVVLPAAVRGIDRTFTGTMSAQWMNANNWSPIGIPTANDRALVGNVATVYLNQTISINSLVGQSSCQIAVANETYAGLIQINMLLLTTTSSISTYGVQLNVSAGCTISSGGVAAYNGLNDITTYVRIAETNRACTVGSSTIFNYGNWLIEGTVTMTGSSTKNWQSGYVKIASTGVLVNAGSGVAPQFFTTLETEAGCRIQISAGKITFIPPTGTTTTVACAFDGSAGTFDAEASNVGVGAFFVFTTPKYNWDRLQLEVSGKSTVSFANEFYMAGTMFLSNGGGGISVYLRGDNSQNYVGTITGGRAQMLSITGATQGWANASAYLNVSIATLGQLSTNDLGIYGNLTIHIDQSGSLLALGLGPNSVIEIGSGAYVTVGGTVVSSNPTYPASFHILRGGHVDLTSGGSISLPGPCRIDGELQGTSGAGYMFCNYGLVASSTSVMIVGGSGIRFGLGGYNAIFNGTFSGTCDLPYLAGFFAYGTGGVLTMTDTAGVCDCLGARAGATLVLPNRALTLGGVLTDSGGKVQFTYPGTTTVAYYESGGVQSTAGGILSTVGSTLSIAQGEFYGVPETLDGVTIILTTGCHIGMGGMVLRNGVGIIVATSAFCGAQFGPVVALSSTGPATPNYIMVNQGSTFSTGASASGLTMSFLGRFIVAGVLNLASSGRILINKNFACYYQTQTAFIQNGAVEDSVSGAPRMCGGSSSSALPLSSSALPLSSSAQKFSSSAKPVSSSAMKLSSSALKLSSSARPLSSSAMAKLSSSAAAAGGVISSSAAAAGPLSSSAEYVSAGPVSSSAEPAPPSDSSSADAALPVSSSASGAPATLSSTATNGGVSSTAGAPPAGASTAANPPTPNSGSTGIVSAAVLSAPLSWYLVAVAGAAGVAALL